jgi:hypothetical protein
VVVLSLLGTTAVAGGCAGPRPATVLVLHVSNELGRPIAEIRRKACDETEAQFTPVEASRIEPGRTLGVELPPTCVDVVAVDGRGRIVGEQRELEMLPGATWVLRR